MLHVIYRHWIVTSNYDPEDILSINNLCMSIFIYVCQYLFMYVNIYLCMSIFMYVNIYVNTRSSFEDVCCGQNFI
jgi:hypothetical protein